MSKRRVVLGIILVMGVFLLSGCGKEKVLRCKASQSGVDIGYNITFKGVRITAMELSYDMDLKSYSDVQIDALRDKDFCEVVKGSMSQYASAFENCTQKIENKNLNVHSDLNVDKVAKNELDKLSSIDKSKKELEEIGYSCTID